MQLVYKLKTYYLLNNHSEAQKPLSEAPILQGGQIYVNPLKATTIGRGNWNYDYIHMPMTYLGCHMSHISPLCVLYGWF